MARCLLLCVAVTATLTPWPSGTDPSQGPPNGPTKQAVCEPPPGFVHIVFLQEFNLHVFVIKERMRMYAVVSLRLDKHICYSGRLVGSCESLRLPAVTLLEVLNNNVLLWLTLHLSELPGDPPPAHLV